MEVPEDPVASTGEGLEEMAEDERRVLLPRPARRSDYQAIGVSPGGYSWHRKISEQSGARSQDSPGFLPVGDLARPSERRSVSTFLDHYFHLISRDFWSHYY